MKKIKSVGAFICSLIFLIIGVIMLLWRDFGTQGALRTLLGVEVVLVGVSQLMGSFSYEAVNNDRKHPPDERSIDIRMRAKAWSFDIVTWIMMIVPPLVGMFDAVDSGTHAIVMVAVYGLLAIALLIKAALLIFYERNL